MCDVTAGIDTEDIRMKYIKIPKVYDKLKKAEELFSPVIMTAGTGWGKSAAVEYYYRRKATLTLTCRNGNITEMPSPDSFRISVVIIEDMQWLSEEESVRYLRRLLHTPGLQVLMLTRGGMIPKYLAAEEIDLGFVRVQETDFAFGEKEVEEYFREEGVFLHPDDALPVTEASVGYPCAVHYYAVRMGESEEGRYTEEIRAAVWQDTYRLWDGQVYEQWSDDFVHFALCVCRFDEFTTEMAEYLTGDRNIQRVIEYCCDHTNQLRIHDGSYSIRPETRRYFSWKQELLWSEEEISENYRRAANYYEMKGNIPDALRYYQKAGATQRVKELLIREAGMHPGTGHYVEAREYYLALPKEEIRKSPLLMSGMSMLYDLILQPEQSEEWYRELNEFYQNRKNSREKRREARARLAYLDIGLPHRGTRGILDIMKDVFALVQKGDIVLPEFCATGNSPSVMNGGLDFCEWSRNDRQIAKIMTGPLEGLLGKYSNGLVTLALAESGFEKGTMSPYEILTRCNDGFVAAAYGGRIEMCFVSVGIQVRQHLIEGQLSPARRIFDAFSEKAALEGAEHLMLNIEAFRVWLSLFGQNDASAENYIRSVPDAMVSFCISDRYRQMMKLRCLIAQDRLDKAFELAAFLTRYFEMYQRTFYWMENELLKAIILYRREDPHWRDHLHGALEKAADYHFVRLVSIEGAAILPLLKELEESGGLSDLGEEYTAQVMHECIRVAVSYPDYLKYIPRETVSLTDREMQVLSMLCAGMTMERICEELGISYAGLKKHNRNIYKKFGVSSRAEAERKALQLGLVHHSKQTGA